jgi:prophage regulatory protein
VTTPCPGNDETEVLGPHELADLLGVSRQRIYQLTSRPTFPPGQRLAIGRVWLAHDIRAWAQATGRTLTR